MPPAKPRSSSASKRKMPAPPDPTMEVLSAIPGVPADRLGDVCAVIAERFVSGEVVTLWRIVLPLADRTIVCDQDDYPLMTLARIERQLGKTWHRISPRNSAEDAAALVVGLLEDVEGLDSDEIDELLRGVSVNDVLSNFEEYTREATPFDSADLPAG